MTRMIDPKKLNREIDLHRLWSGMSTGKQIQWEAAFEAAKVEMPEQKHGNLVGLDEFRCTVCNARFDSAIFQVDKDGASINFCPACGAMLDGAPPCGEDVCDIGQ